MTSFPPPVILDGAAVRALLPQLDVRAELTGLFRALGEGRAVQPPQTLTEFPGGTGDFITYLGAIADTEVFGTKMSPYIVTDGAPIITAWTALMSAKTGQPLVWCDAAQLTVERTAGTTALAVDLLAQDSAKTLAIIGSGAVAEAHFRHVADLRDWSSVRVFSPLLKENADRARHWAAMDHRIEIAQSAASCVAGADVVMLCTSSGKPVIAVDEIGRPALITSISTNVANAHEVPPEFLMQADVYCDYQKTTPSSAGEMKLAVQNHGWDVNAIKGDLGGLVCETCPRPSYDKPVFFRSIGLGLEDVAMAYGIWKLSQPAR